MSFGRGTDYPKYTLRLGVDGLAGKLRENPNDILVFVEEIVRLHSTIQYPLRVALRDTRIGDLDLSAGDTFAIAAGAAKIGRASCRERVWR